MCGEHLTNTAKVVLAKGSSPRVRGTRDDEIGVRVGGGIIPACAGNTEAVAPVHHLHRDHPRVCGEHDRVKVTKQGGSGSSPRVRGTRNLVVICRDQNGIIPACAGNTRLSAHDAVYGRDHPRVCGEHSAITSKDSAESGSSPRVRGTRGQDEGVEVAVGIIPACAGNTRR